MDTYSLSDVFNESEIPVLTFVKPREYNDLGLKKEEAWIDRMLRRTQRSVRD